MATSITTESTEGLFEGFEPYKLTGVTITDQELGSGAYASILKLDYMGLKCAGKKIHTALLGQGTSISYTVRKFRDECQLLCRVRHPNIVQFIGVYFEQGSSIPILVMEFLPLNLTQCVREHNLQADISYSILHDVAIGLNYLHGQMPAPIVHRDLSSNNVLLTSNMTAKISDLGVARILDLSPQATQFTQTPGTPAFMPPEVMVAKPTYNTSVDVFSYGAMMIHVLSGKWPEPQLGPTRTDGDRLIPVSETERRERFLQEIGSDHPLIGLIQKCIHNNPEMRATASEIVKRLTDMVELLPAAFTNQLDMIDYIKNLEKVKIALEEENTEFKHSHYTMMARQGKIISMLEKKQEENHREMKGLLYSLKCSQAERRGKRRGHPIRSVSLDLDEQKQESELELTHQEFDTEFQRNTFSPTLLGLHRKSYHVCTTPTSRRVTESETSKHARSASDTLHPLLMHSLKRAKKQTGESQGINSSATPSKLVPDSEEPDPEIRDGDDQIWVTPTLSRSDNPSRLSEVRQHSPTLPSTKGTLKVTEWDKITGYSKTLPSTYRKKVRVKSLSTTLDDDNDGLKYESRSSKSRLKQKSASVDSPCDVRLKHHADHHHIPVLQRRKSVEKDENITITDKGSTNGESTTTKPDLTYTRDAHERMKTAKTNLKVPKKNDGNSKPSLHKQKSEELLETGAFQYPVQDICSSPIGQSNGNGATNGSIPDDLVYPIYAAMSDYEAQSSSELSFKRGDQMHIKGEREGEMWRARLTSTSDKDGYVPKCHLLALEDEEWFFGKLDVHTANKLVMTSSNQAGSFLVRLNKKTGIFSLTVRDQNKARHYHIQKQEDGTLFVSQHCYFRSIHDLVDHHTRYRDGLCTKLGLPCIAPHFVRDQDEVSFEEKVSTGWYPEIWKGEWNNKLVAINKIKPGSVSQVDLLDTCALLKTTDHKNLVQFHAIYMKSEPFLVITEHMPNGSLQQYMPSITKSIEMSELIKISAQIAAAMSYLENRSCIHQDLAARNIMVEICSNDIHCKLSIYPHVHKLSGPDGIYSTEAGSVLMRWLPYKAIVDNQLSIKSNVWSFGVVLWEVVNYCRSDPYPEMSELGVMEKLQQAYRMPSPLGCMEELHQLMVKCWNEDACDRPTFEMIHSELNELCSSNRFGYKQLESDV